MSRFQFKWIESIRWPFIKRNIEQKRIILFLMRKNQFQLVFYAYGILMRKIVQSTMKSHSSLLYSISLIIITEIIFDFSLFMNLWFDYSFISWLFVLELCNLNDTKCRFACRFCASNLKTNNCWSSCPHFNNCN